MQLKFVHLLRTENRRFIQSLSHKRFSQPASAAIQQQYSHENEQTAFEINTNNAAQNAIAENSYQHLDTLIKRQQQLTQQVSNQCQQFDCDELDLSFNNTSVAFKSKKLSQLLRNYLILTLCSSNTLVKNNELLMKVSRKLLGKRLFKLLMKATFYGQFVAGENEVEIKPTIEHLQQFGVKALVDYGAEEDVSGESNATNNNDPLSSEQYCDKNMNIFLNSIDAVSEATNNSGIVAIKLTALGKPQLLMKLSKIVEFMRQQDNNYCSRTSLPVVKQQTQQQLTLNDDNNNNNNSNITDDFSNVANLMNSFQSIVNNYGKNDKHILEMILTEDEEAMLCNLMQRVNKVAAHAREKGVRCMIDAEQTYMQLAINMIALELMRTYNQQQPIVFNTYQCYLKSTFDNVVRDLKISRRDNFCFGAKLVRGAYIEQERERAIRLNYLDPINESYDATSQMYTKTLNYLMNEISKEKLAFQAGNSSTNAKINIMVASHNEDTVRFAVKQMQKLNIQPSDKLICFGLLYGMSDHVSFSLGQAGYSVYKYMPYGPLEEVLPYIGRRAIENNGFLDKLNRERSLIAKEIRSRLLSLNLFYKPVGNYKPA